MPARSPPCDERSRRHHRHAIVARPVEMNAMGSVVLGADVERVPPVDRVDDDVHGCSSAVVRTRFTLWGAFVTPEGRTLARKDMRRAKRIGTWPIQRQLQITAMSLDAGDVRLHAKFYAFGFKNGL